MNKNIEEFLRHSNYIESVYSDSAFVDACAAWDFAELNRNCITLDYVLKIHFLLLRNLRSDIAGKLRNCTVWIGGIGSDFKQKTFIHEKLLKEQLNDVIYKINCNVDKFVDKEQFTKACHIQFEHVHGFADGNGRTGRILYNIHRLRLGLPIHIIHEGTEQMEYYKWFK